MAAYNRGRRVGRPLVFLFVWGLVALGTAACWPFPGLEPTPTPPATATVAGGAPSATTVALAPASPTAPETAPTPAGVELPPAPTWPPPPPPDITATPPALPTAG